MSVNYNRPYTNLQTEALLYSTTHFTALKPFDFFQTSGFLTYQSGIDIGIIIGICVTIDNEIDIIAFSNHRF